VAQVGTQIILDGQAPDSKTVAEVLQLVRSELSAAQGAASTGLGGALPAQPQAAEPAAEAARPGAPEGGPQNTIVVGGGQGGGGSSAPPLPSRDGGGGLSDALIVNRIHIPGPRQILLKVKIAELDRTALREIGVNFDVINTDTVIRST